MKNTIKIISRRLGKFDVSPFTKGGYAKLFLYLLWGINAGVFISHDKQADNDYGNEQIRIIEHKTDIEQSITECDNINSTAGLSLFHTGTVYLTGFTIFDINCPGIFSNRAPPSP